MDQSRALPVPLVWLCREVAIKVGLGVDRATSLIRNRAPLGPYSRTKPRAYGGPRERVVS